MGVKRFSCSECGAKYATKGRYDTHMKTHKTVRGKKSIECESCGVVFTSAAMLKKHKLNCSKPTDRTVTRGRPSRGGKKSVKPESSKAGENSSAADDALKVQMSTKVLSLFDSSRSNKKNTDSLPKKSRPALPELPPLSAKGIRSMSLSIKESWDKFKTRTVTAPRKSDRTAAKKPNEDVVVSDSPPEEPPKGQTQEVQTRNKRKSVPKKTQIAERISQPRASKSIDKTPDETSSKKSVLIPQKATPTKAAAPKGRGKKKRAIARRSASKVASRRIKKDSLADPAVPLGVDDSDDDDIDGDYVPDGSRSENEDILDKNADDIPLENHSSFSDESHSSPTSNSKEKIFTCTHCSKTFTRRYHLDRHLKSYPCSGLPPPQFACELCNRVYTRKDNLREHLRSHTGEGARNKKYKCSYCNKAFHGMSLLIIHVRKHTGEKPFECEFCPKKFPSAGALTKHRRTHTGEKPFSCPECGYKFALKGTLNRHLRVHTGVRPHQCLYCGKRFIQIGGLKAHLFYHTGENSFKCEDCGKIFNRKARLQMHQLYVHIKSKPFECSHCSKSFTRKEDLNRHAILHTGQKPYKCPTCGKSFAIKPSLKLHLLTHTKEEPRSCHECGRAFIRKDCLLRHMRKRHRDLLDKILLAENDEKFGEPAAVSSRMLSEHDLCENIQELLRLLVEESTLLALGWPSKPVHEVLEAVIRRCGHTPVNPDDYTYIDRMRENAKLLFTVVIDDNAVKTLLNNQTVDEVILHVLRLAKT